MHAVRPYLTLCPIARRILGKAVSPLLAPDLHLSVVKVTVMIKPILTPTQKAIDHIKDKEAVLCLLYAWSEYYRQ